MKARIIIIIFFFLLLSFVLQSDAQTSKFLRDPLLNIAYPSPESFVTNTITITAGSGNPSFNKKIVQSFAFEYSFDRVQWNLIENVSDIPAAEWNTHWNVEELPSGPVFIRIKLIDVSGKLWQAISRIFINKAPASVYDVNRDNQNGVLILDGRSSSDQDDTIIDYHWLIDTDNPFELDGDVVSIPLNQLPTDEEFGITLTVADTRNGTDVNHTLLTLPNDTTTTTTTDKTCGCAMMTVKDTGAAQFPMWWVPPANNMVLGPYDDVNLSGITDFFAMVHNFQVEATLKPKSDPEKCPEGQRDKLSYKVGANKYDTKGANSTINATGSFLKGSVVSCPFSGTDWRDDDYNMPEKGYKVHIGQDKIIWEDGPGYSTEHGKMGIPRAWITGGGVELNFAFEGRVTGPAGFCQCDWEINMKIEKDGTVSKNKLENLKCTSG